MNDFSQEISRETSLLRLRIARAFGRSASRYDQHAELQRDVADRLLSLLPATAHHTPLLDIGCGTGYCSQQLRQRFPKAGIVAIDLALPMLQATRARMGSASAAHLVCGDAEDLPLASDSVDLLVSSLVLQWCSDPVAVLAEFQRVLRPGGVALVSTLGPATLRELRDAWAEVDGRSHSNEFLPAPRLQQAVFAAGLHGQLDSEMQIRHYDSLLSLAHELKGLGANVVVDATSGHRPTPAAFKAAANAFARRRQPDGIPVHWEIFYLTLGKPATGWQA